jgi:hypothetical protein
VAAVEHKCAPAAQLTRTAEPLTTRLGVIGQVVKKYRDSAAEGAIPEDPPFTLIGKSFFPKRDIRRLFERIHEER